MNYAVVYNNEIIEILENQENKPKWPPMLNGDTVDIIPCEEWVKQGCFYDYELQIFSPPNSPQYIELTIDPDLEIIPQEYDISLEDFRKEIIDDYTLNLIKIGVL